MTLPPALARDVAEASLLGWIEWQAGRIHAPDGTLLIDLDPAEAPAAAEHPGVHERPRVCRHGHEQSGRNVYTSPAGREYCRPCKAGYERLARRGQKRSPRRTHCPRGHPYDAGNTYTDPSGASRCRTCRSTHDQRRTKR